MLMDNLRLPSKFCWPGYAGFRASEFVSDSVQTLCAELVGAEHLAVRFTRTHCVGHKIPQASGRLHAGSRSMLEGLMVSGASCQMMGTRKV
jgi:hypothetical protein